MEPVKAKIIPKKPTPRPKKPKRIWDNYKVVGEVLKSDRIKIVVAAAIRDGVKYINIREFYLRQKDQEWKPGRDGITIPVIIPINKGTELIHPYRDFDVLLHDTVKTLNSMELYDEANAIYKEDKQNEN